MKVKAVILSLLFLLTGSGLKVEIATCCDVFSGISLHFKNNGLTKAEKCCLCLKASKAISCCHTQSFSTVINPVLGLEKSLTISARQFSNELANVKYKYAENNLLQNAILASSKTFNQIDYPVPILIKKRVLQI